jgi:hypothetical protein
MMHASLAKGMHRQPVMPRRIFRRSRFFQLNKLGPKSTKQVMGCGLQPRPIPNGLGLIHG